MKDLILWESLNSEEFESAMVDTVLQELQFLSSPNSVRVHSLSDLSGMTCFSGIVHPPPPSHS